LLGLTDIHKLRLAVPLPHSGSLLLKIEAPISLLKSPCLRLHNGPQLLIFSIDLLKPSNSSPKLSLQIMIHGLLLVMQFPELGTRPNRLPEPVYLRPHGLPGSRSLFEPGLRLSQAGGQLPGLLLASSGLLQGLGQLVALAPGCRQLLLGPLQLALQALHILGQPPLRLALALCQARRVFCTDVLLEELVCELVQLP
jgi:hypothetical protein